MRGILHAENTLARDPARGELRAMRLLIASLTALSLHTAEASAQSTTTNPLDKPAQPSGSRRYSPRPQPAEPPLGSSGGRELQATSTPKIGFETWVAREKTANLDASDPRSFWVHFYRVEKPAALTPGGLAPKLADAVPRPRSAWWMTRGETRNLAQLLYKFGEWSDLADKNRVQVVDKEIGKLSSRYQTLWFHREKEVGPSKSWLIVTDTHSATQTYRFSAADVAGLLELLEKLPALDDELLGRTAPRPPTLQPPNPATEELFK